MHRTLLLPGLIAALILAIAATIEGFGQQTPAEPTTLVPVFLTVTDREGKFVTGAGPDDFVVEENGESREIRLFSLAADIPLTVALAIDYSGSSVNTLRSAIGPARTFLNATLGPNDQALVAGIASQVTLLQDLTRSDSLLDMSLDGLTPGGGSAIFDAIQFLSLDRLGAQGGRKAIVLLSDGEDTASRTRREDAIRSAQLAHVIVYAISIRDPQPPRLFRRPGNADNLEAFADATGGAVLGPLDPQGVQTALEAITLELGSQYALAYVSPDSPTVSEYREIRVRPRDPDLAVRARRGYYAAAQGQR